MKKVPFSDAFDKAYHHLRPYGVLAVAVYGYIEGFERQQKPCFASRQHIAKVLYSSPGSVARALQTLKKAGHITISWEAKKRVLKTVKTVIRNDDTVITMISNPDQYDQSTLINMINYEDLDLLRSSYKDLDTKKRVVNMVENSNRSVLDPDLKSINAKAARLGLKKRFNI